MVNLFQVLEETVENIHEPLLSLSNDFIELFNA